MTQVLIPVPNSGIVDARTGTMSREWFAFFAALLERAKGAALAWGHVTLVAGTATVQNANAVLTNEFALTAKVKAGAQGILSVGAVVANTSFVINSSNAGDTSTVSWVIFAPSGS